MKTGSLYSLFTGVVAKKLSAVEALPSKSNQHEFNGVKELRNLLGSERITDCPTHFIWLGGENQTWSDLGATTWYDARERHPTRTEYRLYFRSNQVMNAATEGDLLVVARRQNGALLAVIAPGGSTMENQLLWLFDVPTRDGSELEYRDLSNDKRALGYAERYILEELGVEADEPNADYLDGLIDRFGIELPSTAIFSEFARGTLPEVAPLEDPDSALLSWIEREEALFKRLERRIVSSRLEQGFISEGEADVDGFVSFSLSVHNRRKSRAGHALEHHLAEIFKQFGVRCSRGAVTEGRKTPDFLFPGASEYHNPEFPFYLLSMLGAKSTCKDRWRQVLSEAGRIKEKHLLTLEPSISTGQTCEMQASNLRLVIPRGLHNTFTDFQRDWLLDLSSFIEFVVSRQD